jgi:hypothetical protein
MLRGVGGVALGLPLLDAMRSDWAKAGTDSPKRVIFMYTPNGTIADNFWPTGSESNFTLGPILSPLEPHKQDLLILRGIDMLSTLHGPGDAHQKGTGHCLTATELLEGTFQGDAGLSAGWAGGISIDQELAKHIAGDTRYPTLELGVAVQGSTVDSRICYRDAGQPLPPEISPYAAYERLFGEALGDPLEVERKKSRRRALLDAVLDEHRTLRDQLGGEDRVKLENHITAVDGIRARLDQASLEFAGECKPLMFGEPIDHTVVANMPVIGQLQIDLMVMAMACDLTRIGTLMWTQSRAPHVYSFIDPAITEGHHSIAHKGDEDAVKIQHNTLINQWFAGQLEYLVRRLKETPEGDGSLFDNTLIVWVNEQQKGNNHSREEMPYLMIGSAGGYFNTGRYVQQNGDTGHGQLFVSVLNAMGVDTDTFGNPAFGKGPLTGLT